MDSFAIIEAWLKRLIEGSDAQVLGGFIAEFLAG